MFESLYEPMGSILGLKADLFRSSVWTWVCRTTARLELGCSSKNVLMFSFLENFSRSMNVSNFFRNFAGANFKPSLRIRRSSWVKVISVRFKMPVVRLLLFFSFLPPLHPLLCVLLDDGWSEKGGGGGGSPSVGRLAAPFWMVLSTPSIPLRCVWYVL